MRRALYPGPHPEIAISLDNLAVMLYAQGDLDGARRLLEQALEMQRGLYHGPHAYVAISLDNLGIVLRAQGDLDGARRRHEQALEMQRGLYHGPHAYVANSLDHLAAMLRAQGDLDGARRLAGQARMLAQQILTRELPSLDGRAQIRLLEALRGHFDFDLSLADDPRGAFAAVAYLKGLPSAAAGVRRQAAARPAIAELAQQARTLRERLNRLHLASVSSERIAERGRATRGLADELASAETKLARAVEWHPEAPDPDRLLQLLSDDAALVDIIRYNRYLPRGLGRNVVARSEATYAAFVCRAGQPVARVDLGPAEHIDRSLAAWRDRILVLDAYAEPQGRDLRARVWEPIRPHLDGVRTVIVSPDGDLNFLPWAALPGDEPGSFLVERYAFGTIASARQLLAWGEPRQRRGAAGGLLALGGVDFDAAGRAAGQPLLADARPTGSGRGFRSGPIDHDRPAPPLRGTGVEALAVAALYRRANKPHAGPVATLAGTDATKERVIRELVGRRYVHLATHGYFADERHPSALGAASVEQRLERRLFEQIGRDELVGWAPGLLSGLCFAGYNRPPADPASGGPDRGAVLMTAEEVEGLDLTGCELVVLSACETGLGRVAGGEGVMGLQRAFHVAGARSVIASLWRVDDASTLELMEAFYRHLWADGLPQLEALRRAQLDVLEHPERVEARRKELAVQIGGRDLGPSRPLPDGGRIATASGPSRSSPALWAGFVLSGAID
jgi:CHAT domain-containing protein